jgi:predicted Zn-dependent peptidase
MSRIGKAELVHGELLSVDQVLSRIDSVSLDDVSAVASDLLTSPQTLAVVGPFDESRDFTTAVG